jgi:hypothetical protein
MENLNVILRTSAPTRALSTDALKNQLEANLNLELLDDLCAELVVATTLAPWKLEVKEWDDRLELEWGRIQKLIDTNNIIRTARRAERRVQSQPWSPLPTEDFPHKLPDRSLSNTCLNCPPQNEHCWMNTKAVRGAAPSMPGTALMNAL